MNLPEGTELILEGSTRHASWVIYIDYLSADQCSRDYTCKRKPIVRYAFIYDIYESPRGSSGHCLQHALEMQAHNLANLPHDIDYQRSYGNLKKYANEHLELLLEE